jgi:hypothetical protein
MEKRKPGATEGCEGTMVYDERTRLNQTTVGPGEG